MIRAWIVMAALVVGACGAEERVHGGVEGMGTVGNEVGAQSEGAGAREFVGFDRNNYPGDAALAGLHRHFAFVGYWLTNPPGETTNGWVGKRVALREAGFGFLVLANGHLYVEIQKAAKVGTTPAALGGKDAAMAVAAARREHFPLGTIVFLDQEEGGRLLAEQAAYLLAWTEAVAQSGYQPGVYASGQPVDEGLAPSGGRLTITTAQDIQARVRAGRLHKIALWVAQDTCPPSNGCSLKPPPMERSGTAEAEAWQYAQSPRRPEITKACTASYAPDGNCYVPEFKGMHLDLDLARSADPSRGR
jgi:hypothetical protein